MKGWIYAFPSVFLFYAVVSYTNQTLAILITLGFLAPLFDLIIKKYVGYEFMHTIIPLAIATLISLFQSSIWYFTLGYLFQLLLAIFDRGIKVFKPFTNLNLNYKLNNLENRVLFWSVLGIILVAIQ